MRDGLKTSLRQISGNPDRELVIPLLGSALAESELAAESLDLLLQDSETRAPREIVRGFHHLNEDLRARAVEGAGARLARAARQLLRSDRERTRENVVHLLHQLAEGGVLPPRDLLSALLGLIDDPSRSVRDGAREVFLGWSSPWLELEEPPRDMICTGLGILLRHFDQHEDDRVLTLLLGLGDPGADLLGRAVGERWPVTDAIVDVARRPAAAAELGSATLSRQVDGLFRWLRSPFPATREIARTLLRERVDTPFLACVTGRLEDEQPEQRAREYPVYRHIRWEQLDDESLGVLSPETLLRIAHYLQASHGTPEERVVRLARLLRVARGDTCRAILDILKEHDTAPVLSALAPLLASDDEDLQLRCTALIPPRSGKHAFILLVGQLGSPFEEVRDLAQRKISGQSLAFFLDAFDSLEADARRRILPVLKKVDLHFVGQLRRALRTGDEQVVVKALRTVVEVDDVHAVEDTLLDLTVSPSARIRATLTRALKTVDREASLHYLRLFLADSDLRVVANAVEVLGELGDAQARSWLAGLREHTNARIRANALLALARLGDATARTEIQDLAKSGPDTIRASAAWAEATLKGAA